MSVDQVNAFFEQAGSDPQLQQKLTQTNADDSQASRDNLFALAEASGYSFDDDDYLAWYVQQSYGYLAANLSSAPNPFPQYGLPYSSFPPIPPPMPTYLPPPPHIPPDSLRTGGD